MNILNIPGYIFLVRLWSRKMQASFLELYILTLNQKITLKIFHCILNVRKTYDVSFKRIGKRFEINARIKVFSDTS